VKNKPIIKKKAETKITMKENFNIIEKKKDDDILKFLIQSLLTHNAFYNLNDEEMYI
jgi:hypothetical protein